LLTSDRRSLAGSNSVVVPRLRSDCDHFILGGGIGTVKRMPSGRIEPECTRQVDLVVFGRKLLV